MTTALLLDILDKHLKEAQTIYIAGWSSPVARRAHNPKVVSSNLAPATIFKIVFNVRCMLNTIFFCVGRFRRRPGSIGVFQPMAYSVRDGILRNFRCCFILAALSAAKPGTGSPYTASGFPWRLSASAAFRHTSPSRRILFGANAVTGRGPSASARRLASDDVLSGEGKE